jgi:hypothetical protein
MIGRFFMLKRFLIRWPSVTNIPLTIFGDVEPLHPVIFLRSSLDYTHLMGFPFTLGEPQRSSSPAMMFSEPSVRDGVGDGLPGDMWPNA